MQRSEINKLKKSAFFLGSTLFILVVFVYSYSQPMKKMYWGTDDSHFYVKNLSGTTFGASGSDEFYLYWKMDNTATGMGGELTQFKSSEISPSSPVTSAANMLPTDPSFGTFGYHDHYSSGNYSSSAKEVSANPSYTVLESSDTRVRLRINNRFIDGVNVDYSLNTIWTIYPTGQIFRYDSLSGPSIDIADEFVRFRMKYDGSNLHDSSSTDYRCVLYNAPSTHDFVAALVGSGDKNGT